MGAHINRIKNREKICINFDLTAPLFPSLNLKKKKKKA